ncbi:MAG: hypothetical protein U0359_04500 [Byssovorax sp.]
MSLGRIEKTLMFTAAAAACSAALLGMPGEARAQTAVGVNPMGKGTAGGALLGGEVVCITLGAVGVEKGWPYLAFGGLGMVGGGVGGYFVDKATSTAPATGEPSLYMLAGGLALVIPALVLSLNATAYKPPETDRQNEPVNNEPAKDGPKPRAQRRGPSLPKVALRPELPHIPISLFDFYQGKVALGVPAVEVRPLYQHEEMWKYGVTQGSELRVPLFKAAF